MLIGVPKEIKNNENRIGLTPAGAEALVKAGHQVVVEQGIQWFFVELRLINDIHLFVTA